MGGLATWPHRASAQAALGTGSEALGDLGPDLFAQEQAAEENERQRRPHGVRILTRRRGAVVLHLESEYPI
jgi:hypothetical protein